MKHCSKCDRTLPVANFNANKAKRDGLQSACKECKRAYARAHYQENRSQYTARSKERKARVGKGDRYGLSPERYAELLARHDGLCWICLSSPGTHVDHDHSCCPGGNSRACGECVRGVLCGPCNSGLGFFRDSSERLSRAIDYLNYTPT